ELAPAALLVALYAGGKGARYLSEAEDISGAGLEGPRRLQMPELSFEGLKEVAERLEERLGVDGIRELARYIQARREAAAFVGAGGEPAAAALYEARGDVARAQAWLSRATPERAGPTPARGIAGKGLGGVASLVDETAGLTSEVVEAKLVRVELDSAGPRLPGNVAVLKKLRPSLSAPPPEAQGHPLWSEYVAYWENRLAELERGKPVKPPLAWEGYERMRGRFARGLAFERAMVSLLRADAALPKARRRFLQGFNDPHIETYVGVEKPDTGLRFADVLVIERQPPPGQPPRVETFSFKSRDLQTKLVDSLTAQMEADANEALRYYGGTLDIRRPALELRGKPVPVQRVRLVYDGELKPKNAKVMTDTVTKVESIVKGVEVLFE
ncbi:MAG: hypothetical protein ACXU86_19660, partial [Archangium sp.]